jgi:hypothetical protein
MSAKDDFRAVLTKHLEQAETMCDVARLDPEFVDPVAGERLKEIAAAIKRARELVDEL